MAWLLFGGLFGVSRVIWAQINDPLIGAQITRTTYRDPVTRVGTIAYRTSGTRL